MLKELPPRPELCENGCGRPATYLTSTKRWICAQGRWACPVAKAAFVAKRKATLIERYGSCLSAEHHAKRIQTSLERYGVIASYPASRFQPHGLYFPRILQEVLDEEGLLEEDVLVGNDVPPIAFEYEGQMHQYHADIFIPGQNKLISVRSEYAYNKRLEQNLCRKRSALALGYQFEFRIRGVRIQDTHTL